MLNSKEQKDGVVEDGGWMVGNVPLFGELFLSTELICKIFF